MTDSHLLTPMQLGMVFHYLTVPEAGYDIEQIVIRLDEEVDAKVLESSFETVLNHHKLLTKRVKVDGSGDHRFENSAQGKLPFTLVTSDVDVDEFLVQDRASGIDLFEGPLARVALLQHSPNQFTCIWTFHHILFDGRNFPDLLVDIFETYDAQAGKKEHPLSERPDQSAYLDWLSRQNHRNALAHWQKRLEGIVPYTLFTREGGAPGARRQIDFTFAEQETGQFSAYARQQEATLATLVQAAWAILLSRQQVASKVVFGAIRAGRAATVPNADAMLGVFINTVPVVAEIEGATNRSLVRQLRAESIAAREHERAPLVEIQQSLDLGSVAFDTLVMHDREILDYSVKSARPEWQHRSFTLYERAPYPVTLYAYEKPSLYLKLAWDDDAMDEVTAQRWRDRLVAILREIVSDAEISLADMKAMGEAEFLQVTKTWNDTAVTLAPDTIPAAFSRQAARSPQDVALIADDETLSYEELDRRAGYLAAMLKQRGVGPDSVVGISISRSAEMMVAVLGVLKAGGAYLPLDPEYPVERLRYCIADAGAKILLTEHRYRSRFSASDAEVIPTDEFPTEGNADALTPAAPENLAYLIYTSGSTGKPKGVMVEHRNVINFFNAMDKTVETNDRKVWLAVTSLSFDISVLELLWTLTRGFTVVLHGARSPGRSDSHDTIKFSLFYFADEPGPGASDPYELVMTGAKFGDTHGFEAIYTPERHFHSFGGLYPNPAVMGAAIAACTSRIKIRAGSVVLPLHHPLRIAEEWALVDNLSKGRVGISFASGWQPNDFVLAPENYENRGAVMYDGIEKVRKLWSGGKIEALNPKGDMVELGTLPRPVQKELPIWITTAGNPESWAKAGAIGANILTHLLGQTPADIAEKIKIYRDSRAANGFDPDDAQITVMLHTFVGSDAEDVREIVRQPMRQYLKSSASLVGQYADAWTAYKQGQGGARVASAAIKDLSEQEMEDLLDFAFERYFETSALFGSPEKCSQLVDLLTGVGVTEIACLIDFGVDTQTVISHLKNINELRELIRTRNLSQGPTLAEDIRTHGVSHLQTTPSLARMLVLQAEDADYGSLRQLLVGGEALPADLLRDLFQTLPEAEIVNMYGPTETTIWSSTANLARDFERITIGRPIDNTTMYVLDENKMPAPIGRPGELYIGGEGVTRGYHNRQELTAAKFHTDAFGGAPHRMYATGDLVRFLEDGSIEYLGRKDDQVKVRGHRIELGEIETRLRQHPEINEAVVAVKQDLAGTSQLVAYFTKTNAERAIEPSSLREFLRTSLPDYMIPNSLAAIDVIPLTPNGKVDRKALPDIVPQEQHSGGQHEDAKGDVEEQILTVWRQVLGLDEISVNANFFDLGGHSILAVKVQGQLVKALDRKITVVDLFRYPTIRGLALHLSGEAPDQTRGSSRAAKRRERMGSKRST